MINLFGIHSAVERWKGAFERWKGSSITLSGRGVGLRGLKGGHLDTYMWGVVSEGVKGRSLKYLLWAWG